MRIASVAVSLFTIVATAGAQSTTADAVVEVAAGVSTRLATRSVRPVFRIAEPVVVLADTVLDVGATAWSTMTRGPRRDRGSSRSTARGREVAERYDSIERCRSTPTRRRSAAARA